MSAAKGGPHDVRQSPPHQSIEAFAALRARLVDPFAERALVLREEGLNERALAALEATWSTRLAAGDAAAEELAQAFGEAFSNARAMSGDRFGAARSSESESNAQPGLAEALSGVTSAAESAPPVIEAAPVAAEPTPVQPTYAQPSYAKPTFVQPTPPQEPAAKPAFAQPTYAQHAPQQPTFAPQAPSPPAVAQQAPSPPAAATEYAATAGIDLAAIMKKVVPFDPFAKPSVGAAAGSEEKARPPASRSPEFGGTAEVDIAAIAAAARDRFAKPRGAASGSGPSAPTGAPPVPPVPPAASPRAPPSVTPAPAAKGLAFGETADMDISMIARQVLAFGPRGAPTPAPPPSRAPAAAAPPPPSAAAPSPVVVAAPAPSPPPAMSLDQYALLSAEIAMVGTDPAGRSTVFKRVGIENPEALMAEWRARFAADPALAGRWSAAYAHHYARLRTERSGGR